jgi:hypothetical protein
MTRFRTRSLLVVAVAALCSAAWAGGPPTLSVKALDPGSPEAARGYAFSVNATQCGMVCKAPVTARAEGLVNGRRVTRDVLVVPVKGGEGRWLVKRGWPADGTWALVLFVDSHGKATAVVRLEGSRSDVHLVHRVVSAGEIDAFLRSARPLAG